MTGAEERQFGWLDRRKAFFSRNRLGALVTAATLAAGFFGASSANGAELQAGRVGNVAPIGAASSCDDSTLSGGLRIEVIKSGIAYPGADVELGFSAFSNNYEPLPGNQVIITPKVNIPAEYYFSKKGEPVTIGGGEVWPSKTHRSDYGNKVIQWDFGARSCDKAPRELRIKFRIGNLLGRSCLAATAFGPSTELRQFVICWKVIKPPQELPKSS